MPGESNRQPHTADTGPQGGPGGPPRLPGQRGPRNVMPVEHAKNMGKTLSRLLLYFKRNGNGIGLIFIRAFYCDLLRVGTKTTE